MTLTVAVDGSALGNPGPAGWAWAISETQWDAGGWDHGTNNLGELTSIQQILIATAEAGLADQPLHLLADSQYAINVITKWMHGWKKRGWTKADKKPIANLEVIKDIDRLMHGRKVTFEWVRGHTGHPLNELADDKAREAAELHQAGKVAPGGPGLRSNESKDGRPSDSTPPAGASAGTPPHAGTSAATPPHAGTSAATPPHATEAAEAPPEPLDTSTPQHSNNTRSGVGLPAEPAGAVAAAPPDSLAPDGRSVHTPEAYPATTTAPAQGTCSTARTSQEVEEAQRQLVAAWMKGRERIVEAYLGDGFERVWPNGSRTASFMGTCPPEANITNMCVREVGGGYLVTYDMQWAGGQSSESSVWESNADGLRIIHHQSTMLPLS